MGRRRHPRWFEDWLRTEREATTLRIWQPLLIRGLLQTADHARALFLGGLLNPSDVQSISSWPPGWCGRASSTGPTRPTCGSS